MEVVYLFFSVGNNTVSSENTTKECHRPSLPTIQNSTQELINDGAVDNVSSTVEIHQSTDNLSSRISSKAVVNEQKVGEVIPTKMKNRKRRARGLTQEISGTSESGPSLGVKRLLTEEYDIEAQEVTSPIKERAKNTEENPYCYIGGNHRGSP